MIILAVTVGCNSHQLELGAPRLALRQNKAA